MLKQTNYNVHTLPSGLRLLHIPFPDAASVFIKIAGVVGDRAELGDEKGIAHFFEHLCFDGTTNMPTSEQVVKTISQIGAKYNGTTSDELVYYWTRVLADKAEEAATWLGDMFSNSLYREEDINKERKVIEEELLASMDRPHAVFAELFNSKLFPNHPKGFTSKEIKEFLPNINREKILKYQERMYVSGNFVLLIAGAITLEDAQKLATKHFPSLKPGVRAEFKPVPKVQPVNFIYNRKESEQAQLYLVYPGFKGYTRESRIAAAMSSVLGGGLSSRLLLTLRDKLHLVYTASASHEAGRDFGEFVVGVKFREEKLGEAKRAMIEVVEKFIKEGPTDLELEKAVNQAETSLALMAEDTANHIDHAGYQLLVHDTIKSPRDMMNELKSISKDEVREMAKMIFSNKPHVGLMSKSITEFDFPTIS